MVKFARNCMNKMKDVVKNLEDRLGPDVLDLDFRVGLHSGPVTAGVIRGDKSRFQLFGDTVNTAARMESNGVKGRIHCSQATADKLILAGFQRWLTSREGGIEAKGLGLLATYFVAPEVAKTNTVVSQSMDTSEWDEDDHADLRQIPEESAPPPV
jgi:class 3 adenylate cyclase